MFKEISIFKKVNFYISLLCVDFGGKNLGCLCWVVNNWEYVLEIGLLLNLFNIEVTI